MNSADLRTLRFQGLLLLGLFVGTTGIAVTILLARPWFARKIADRYAPAPQYLQPLIQKATTQPLDPADLANLAPSDRQALYDDWIVAGAGANPAMPAILCKLNPGLYVERAERTVIHGPPELGLRAVEFLAKGDHPDALAGLIGIRNWAARHGEPTLAQRAADGIAHLEKLLANPTSWPTTAPASGTAEATTQKGVSP